MFYNVNVLKSKENSQISAMLSKRRYNQMHGEVSVKSKTEFWNCFLWCIRYLNSMLFQLVFGGFNVSKPHQE